tara:strand:- start:17 stop:319 length:303 start_codon:yes stop_codon:yes gene_type:complete
MCKKKLRTQWKPDLTADQLSQLLFNFGRTENHGIENKYPVTTCCSEVFRSVDSTKEEARTNKAQTRPVIHRSPDSLDNPRKKRFKVDPRAPIKNKNEINP